jgi:hypothetical protein
VPNRTRQPPTMGGATSVRTRTVDLASCPRGIWRLRCRTPIPPEPSHLDARLTDVSSVGKRCSDDSFELAFIHVLAHLDDPYSARFGGP